MSYIDFHCDTLSRLYHQVKGCEAGETLLRNNGEIDLERLATSGCLAQFFACFLHKGSVPKTFSHYGDALGMIELMKESLKEQSLAVLAKSYNDYEAAKAAGKVACFLTVEEGGILENDMNRLYRLYAEGIRLITLTWNFNNCLAGSNKESGTEAGHLKPFGIDVIHEMQRLGILIDVSHLSDEGFHDVLANTDKPFIASHSCCRDLCAHSRNLTDDMIRMMGERGCLVGMNYFGSFLSADGRSTGAAIAHHLRHLVDVGGLEIAALGSDFDGISGELELTGCQDMYKLLPYMEAEGFKPSEIDAIYYKNAERILKML